MSTGRPLQRLRDILQTGDQAGYTRAKRRLPGVTFGGTFSPTRANVHLQQHSGIVHGDLDHLTDMESVRQQLCSDPYTVYCLTSPSANGLKTGIHVAPVADDAAYKRAWHAAANYHMRQYGLTWDRSGKDIARLCYVSWDPDLYLNRDAPLFPVPEAVKSPAPPTPHPRPLCLSPDRRTHYAERAIATAVAMIESSVPGNRHDHRLRAARLLGGYVAGGLLTYDEAWTALAEAVARNTEDLPRSLRTVADGLAYGQAYPITLEELETERRDWQAPHQRHFAMNTNGRPPGGALYVWGAQYHLGGAYSR